MEFVQPRDLPAFLDPLLDYLAEHLPDPLYSLIFNLLSYGVMLLSGLLTLIASLPSYKPWEWDAQTILPPLISVLAAYYVLLTMYRTTGWMIRLGLGAVKWTVILAAVAWVLNGGGGGNGVNGTGVGGGIVNFMNELVNGHGNNRSPSGRRGGGGSSNTRTGSNAPNRPRPWDTFTTHQQWQYNENDARRQNQANEDDTQNVITQVFLTVSRAFGMFDGAAGGILQNLAGMATEGGAGGTGNEGTNGNRGVGAGAGANTRRRTRAKPNQNTRSSTQRRTNLR